MEIKKLRQQRPLAAKHTRELEAMRAGSTVDATKNPSATMPTAANREEHIQMLNEQLDKLKEEQSKIGSELDKLKEEQSKKMGNLKPLIEKRTKLRDEVTALQDNRRS